MIKQLARLSIPYWNDFEWLAQLRGSYYSSRTKASNLVLFGMHPISLYICVQILGGTKKHFRANHF